MIDISSLYGITCKWPQCVIVGKKLTKEQAREVIIKTDLFFNSSWAGGNDEDYEKELRKRLNMPPLRSFDGSDGEDIYTQNDVWQSTHGCLSLNYLNNNWISSCYVGGPNGWCHIDGTIHSNKNIGKWPAWNEIIEDLETLAHAFPFLDICLYIIDCESCCGWGNDEYERKCIGGIHLCNGKLETVDPIDPFSEECKPTDNFAGWDKISDTLKNEVASVVTPVDNSYFNSRCPNEQIFKIEEAIEYFGEI